MKLGHMIDNFLEWATQIFMEVLFLPLDLCRFVCRVISGPEKPNSLSELYRQASHELYQKDLAEMGRAFPVLLEGLPPELQDVKLFFSSLPLIDGKYKEEVMLKDPDVVNGGSQALELAEYGLSPKVLYDVCDGIGSVFCYANRRGYSNSSFEIFRVNSPQNKYTSEDRKIWLEIFDVIWIFCDIEASFKVFDWCVSVSLYKPYLFPDFRVESLDGGKTFRLVPDNRKFRAVAERWGTTHMTEVDKV